jgi:hypothetical protein
VEKRKRGQKGASHTTDRPIKVGLLGPREARILDLAGPWEVFTRADDILAEREPTRKPDYHLQLATIDASNSIECFGRLFLRASGGFHSLDPRLDTLLVGGGRARWGCRVREVIASGSSKLDFKPFGEGSFGRSAREKGGDECP